MQPTGSGLHLGNYLGAMRSWLALQDKYETYYCVVDLHAITIPQDPVALRNATVSSAAVYMAAGVDPERATLFVQSHVPAHSEMTWLLNCVTPIGWMERMIQFKVRRGHHCNVHRINEDHVDARQLSPQLAQRDRDARAHVQLTASAVDKHTHTHTHTHTQIVPRFHDRKKRGNTTRT